MIDSNRLSCVQKRAKDAEQKEARSVAAELTLREHHHEVESLWKEKEQDYQKELQMDKVCVGACARKCASPRAHS